MKVFLILIITAISCFAQADWDYGDPSPSGYYATIPVDDNGFGYLIGPDTSGWLAIRRELQTIEELKAVLVRIVDSLEDTKPKAKKKKKKVH